MKQLLLLLLLPVQLLAQSHSMQDFKSYPFPTELCSASKGAKIAWAVNEQGRRNIYVAEGPAYLPVKITDFNKDDGQEISSLSITDNGKWVVFVRGGDHGANWDGGLPLNPSFETSPTKVQVCTVPFAGGAVNILSEGDYPEIAPNSTTVAFIKGGQAWVSAIDSAGKAKNIFTTRGTVSSLEWSPDGNQLLFTANRGDHSIIGIYSNASNPLVWVAPSFYRDQNPRWSPDGKQIVFTRMNGKGGAPDSLLPRKPNPWSIWVADITTGHAARIWNSQKTLEGSFPSTDGGANLHWAANNRIVFLSYQDGWPHLYSINAAGGTAQLLTPGNYMAEHISLSADRKWLTFSANTGPDSKDIERRHAARVKVDQPGIEILTPGTGVEWAPVLLNDNQSVAYISATAQRPPLAAVLPLNWPFQKQILLGENLIPSNFPQQQLVIPKQVIYTSADGVEVHADLFEPANIGTGKHPAIVFVHGGPPRQMLLGWHYSDYYANGYACNQYLASLGFVVLSVNYRLGIGYGFAFHHPANAGLFGAAEYRDIVAAGKWLQQQSFVDGKRIGIYGGSYGGYLTAMALSRDSKLFATGVDIHGVHDWVELSNLVKDFAGKYEKAPDYEKALQVAWQSSPVSSIKTWTSPVLIIHADDDRNVPFNQSVDLINRLEKQKVNFETKMIVDDTHHWMKFSNAVSVYAAAAAYFVQQLKP